MTTIAFASISALDRPLAEAARAAARSGADGLEVTARPPHLDEIATPDAAQRAGDAVRAAGLEVVAFGSYLGAEGPASEEAIAHDVAIARALATPRLRVWPGQSTSDDDDAGPVVAFLQATCDRAADAGIDVVVERHDGSFADTVARTDRLLDAVARGNLHLNYQVRDLLRPSDLPGLADDVRKLIPRSRYFHLKNYRPNPDEAGPFLPGGDLENGVLDYREILSAAVEAGYAGPYTLEFLAWDERSLEEKISADIACARRILAELGAE
ncbi:MAG: sugar phosphate isomerase/epimerase family protein [Myxococcota bacterium]